MKYKHEVMLSIDEAGPEIGKINEHALLNFDLDRMQVRTRILKLIEIEEVVKTDYGEYDLTGTGRQVMLNGVFTVPDDKPKRKSKKGKGKKQFGNSDVESAVAAIGNIADKNEEYKVLLNQILNLINTALGDTK
jgi:hypothetical protein